MYGPCFQKGVVGPKNAAMPLITWLLAVNDQSFTTRYYTTLYLNGVKKYRLSNFKVQKKAIFV
jgi:hypothetical protein